MVDRENVSVASSLLIFFPIRNNKNCYCVFLIISFKVSFLPPCLPCHHIMPFLLDFYWFPSCCVFVVLLSWLLQSRYKFLHMSLLSRIQLFSGHSLHVKVNFFCILGHSTGRPVGHKRWSTKYAKWLCILW